MSDQQPTNRRSLREFGGEVGIIVVGVLIALAAQQIVEMLEWRQKIHAAEDAMRSELRDDDGIQAYARYSMHPCIQGSLDQIRDGVERRLDRGEILRLIDRYQVPFWTWDSLGYQATIASDVPTHMPSEQMQAWTNAYATIPALDRANSKEFSDAAELESISRVGGPLSETERTQILKAVESLRRDDMSIFAAVRVMLPATRKAGIQLHSAVKQDSIQKILEPYRECLQPPPAEMIN